MPTTSLHVFCRPTSSTAFGNYAYAKVYGVRIKNSSGTLIHNYVPRKNNSTGKVGLYDTLGTTVEF